jgi:hypothetical protein
LTDFLWVTRRCLTSEDAGGLDVMAHVIDAIVAFACQDGGQKLASKRN